MSNFDPKTPIDLPDALIGELTDDLKGECPRCPYRHVSIWFVLSLIYLAIVVYVIGLRGDMSEKLTESVYLFETSMVFVMFSTAALASSWLSFPDCVGRPWMKIVPVTLFGTFLLWIGAHMIEQGGSIFDGSLHIGHCAQEGLLMEVVPIIALIIITMRGHTTQPYWSMAMNILAVSSLGWIGLRLTCPMADMGHVLINHIMPFAVVGAGLSFFARKLFKW